MLARAHKSGWQQQARGCVNKAGVLVRSCEVGRRGCDGVAIALGRLRRRQCCGAETDEAPESSFEGGGRRVELLEVLVVVEVIDSR